jgi:hypothetical protein
MKIFNFIFLDFTKNSLIFFANFSIFQIFLTWAQMLEFFTGIIDALISFVSTVVNNLGLIRDTSECNNALLRVSSFVELAYCM